MNELVKNKIFKIIVIVVAFITIVSSDSIAQQSGYYYPANSNYWTGRVDLYAKYDDEIKAGTATLNKFRSWAKFDISDIPNNSTVTQVDLYFYVNTPSSEPSLHEMKFGKLISDPVTASYTTIWNESISYTYIQCSSCGDTPGDKNLINMTTLIDEIQSSLTQNWFAISFYEMNEDADRCIIDGHTSSNKPHLRIDFNLPAPTVVSATDGTYCDKVRITWNSVTNADIYYIYRGTDYLGWTTNTYYDDYGALTSSQTYKVHAAKSSAGSGYSANNGSNSGYKSSNASIGGVTGPSPLCIGATATYTANSVVLGGGTGSWSSSNTNVASVNSSGLVTALGAGNCDIIYTITGGCSGTKSAWQGLTVNPNNTLTLTSASGTNNQTVCINTTITPITYSTSGATGTTFSGLPQGVTGNWAANVVTISGTPTVSGPFNYTVTLTGGCGVVTANGTITVNPNNTITLTSASGTNNQTLCINMAITPVTYSTTGATGATFTGLPPGVTGSWAANVVTINGTPTSSGIYNYIVTLSGGCGVVTSNGTITINANNTITLTSASGTDNQTVCINTAITPITYSNSGATGTTFSGLPQGVTGSWAANVVTISGTPTASGTFNYTVSLSGGCGVVTANGTIAVKPNDTITLSSAPGTNNQTVCINTTITPITFSTAGATGAAFSGDLPPGVTGSWAANVVTISGTPTVSGTFNYAVLLTGGCGVFTANGTITVNPNNTITLTSAPGTNNQTVCINTAITPITYSTTGATGATCSGLPPGVTGSWAANVVTISGTPSASGTFNYTVTLTGGCGVVTTNGTITVNPNNTITLTSATGTNNQTVCINAAITPITYSTTRATGATFSGLPQGVTGNWDANVVTISGTLSVSGTFNYTVLLTGGCGVVTANGTITVNPNNTITLTSASRTNNQTVCINTAITPITYSTSGATGAIFDGLPQGVTGNWAANAVTINGTPSTSGTYNYSITLTGGCGDGTANGNITINPAGQVDQPVSQVVCNGNNTATVNFSTSNSGGITAYSWINDNLSIGLPASGTGNIPAFVAVNTSTSPITATILVSPTFTSGTVSCVGPNKSFTIMVNPTGQVNQPDNQLVCNGSNIAAINFATLNSGGTTTYSWTNDNTSIGLSASGTGNIQAFKALNTGNSPVMATIVVTPTFTIGSAGCTGPIMSFTITVNPSGQVNHNQLPDTVICNENRKAEVKFTTNNTGGTTKYEWTNNNPGIGLPASGTGDIGSFVTVNSGTSPAKAKITVMPTFTNGTVGCVGQMKAFTITVNPLPAIIIKWGDVLICPNVDTLFTSYQWIKDNVLIPGAIKQYLVTSKQSGAYKVKTIDKNGCKSSSNDTIISASKSLMVYPNPAKISFSIRLNDEPVGKALIKIINETGIVVREIQTEKTSTEFYYEIPVRDLDEGVYFIWVSVNQVNLYYSKIVVNK